MAAQEPTKLSCKSWIELIIYSIVNGVDVLSKTFRFVYSYFTLPSGSSAALKLNKLEVLENSSPQTVVQQYKFTYFTDSFSWQGNYLNARDLWGYYNGAIGNTDLLIPTTISYQPTVQNQATNHSFGGGTNRAVNTTYIKEGVLKKVEFPTKGYTEFDYESNKYLEAGTPTLAGGLRVTKITSNDGNGGPAVVKTFKYGDSGTTPESGNGVANFSELQFNYSNTQLYYSNCVSGQPVTNYKTRTFFSNTAFTFDQSPVVYPYVTEYLGDHTQSTIGKVAYIFDSGVPPLDVNHVIPQSGKYYRNSLSWKRGMLTRKTVFDADDNKLKETIFSYSALNEISKTVGLGVYQYIVGNLACSGVTCNNEAGEPVNVGTFSVQSFGQDSGVLLESSMTEKNYVTGDVNKYVSSTTSKSFESTYLRPTISTVTKSNGEQFKTVNRFPFHLAPNISSTGNAQAIYLLNQRHIVSNPIETYAYHVNGSSENIVSAQATTYRLSENNLNHVVPDKIYMWESSTLIPKSSYAEVAINGGNSGVTMDSHLKEQIRMIMYNAEGDVKTVTKSTSAPISSQLPGSYQYRYNKTLPVAEVVNAKDDYYNRVQAETGSTGITVGGQSPVTSSNISFTVDYQGTVRIKLGVNGSPSFTTYADYSGSLGNGSMTLGNGSCANTEVVFNNVTPGAKTIQITVRTDVPGTFVGACGQVEYPDNVTYTGGITEFFIENFEELASMATTTPHTGKQYKSGDYSPAFQLPNARSYIIEYWYLSSGQWTYKSKPYTGPTTAVNEGDAIDNVRIYPADARMKSYTYDPILGMTSMIDENGTVMFYDYDTFGRLWRVRNEKGGIEKQYTYNYKTD